MGSFQSLQVLKKLDFDSIYKLSQPDLRTFAQDAGVTIANNPSRSQVLRLVMQHTVETQSLIRVSGLLEVLADGNGLLVYANDNYKVREYATFIPKVLIKRYGLLRGHALEVLANSPRGEETAPYAQSLICKRWRS